MRFVLALTLLLKEYGVQFLYLLGMENVVADTLSRLDIEDITRLVEEIATLLNATEERTTKSSTHIDLIYQEQIKLEGQGRWWQISQANSFQNIAGFNLLCFNDKIYISQPL